MTALHAVLDTNVVLDLFVFRDCAMDGLRAGLESGGAHWIATPAMRDELARVLDYPLVRRQLAGRGGDAAGVLREFDERAILHAAPAPAPVRCADADDQMFIDLAADHGALLLSRDREVLRLRARLAALGVAVAASFPVGSRQPSLLEDA